MKFLERLKQIYFLQIFTIYTRYLIGAAFVISVFSLGKFASTPWLKFENNPPVDSAARFFQTMMNSGMYWHFIGWSQLIAGFLLMTQRYAKLGALLFLPIITNVFIITVSYHFHGTPIITGLMLLANIYLVIWDWDTIQYAFFNANLEGRINPNISMMKNKYWIYLGLIMFCSIIALPALSIDPVIGIFICFAEGLLAFSLHLIYRKKLN